VTHSWQVILERSSKILVPCTIPFFGIGKPGNDIIIERRGVRNVCRFCLATSHTRDGCRYKKPAAGPRGGNTTGGSGQPRCKPQPQSQAVPSSTKLAKATSSAPPPPQSPPATNTPDLTTQDMVTDSPASPPLVAQPASFQLAPENVLRPEPRWADTSAPGLFRPAATVIPPLPSSPPPPRPPLPRHSQSTSRGRRQRSVGSRAEDPPPGGGGPREWPSYFHFFISFFLFYKISGSSPRGFG
jgi:hypothetical protein